jgi:hypothetical protein
VHADEATDAAQTNDKSRGSDFLARRERATEAAANLEMVFDFSALPDEVAGAVLRRMGDYEVASVSCASKRFYALAATDDALWRGLQLRARRHPAWRALGGSWKASFVEGTAVDAQWRHMHFQKRWGAARWNQVDP